MIDPKAPSLRFIFALTTSGAIVSDFYVDAGGMSGPIEVKADWTSLAIVLLLYRMEYDLNPCLSTINITEDRFKSKESLFKTCFALVKNQIRRTKLKETARPGRHQCLIDGIKAAGDIRHRIEIAVRKLPPHNISFCQENPNGANIEIRDSADMEQWIDLLLGLKKEVTPMSTAQQASGHQMLPFYFGKRATKTFVAWDFPGGLDLDLVSCKFVDKEFSLPKEVRTDANKAYKLVKQSAPSGRKWRDGRLYMPTDIVVTESYDDLEAPRPRLMIGLGLADYRHYTAMSFAESLAMMSNRFQALNEFAHHIPDPRLPSPASCSIGLRIMVETKDERFVVAYRSDEVKTNARMWTCSCNEGLRPLLIERGSDPQTILQTAAFHAMQNELRIDENDCDRLLLLSVTQNSYAQWSCSLCVQTTLESREIKRRQALAHHRYEYRQINFIPLDIEECGKSMRQLGIRWYGGALETISSTLAWREIMSGRDIHPTEVAGILGSVCGDSIVPCDEVNPEYLPAVA